jgi:hypothetical protein
VEVGGGGVHFGGGGGHGTWTKFAPNGQHCRITTVLIQYNNDGNTQYFVTLSSLPSLMTLLPTENTISVHIFGGPLFLLYFVGRTHALVG